MEIFNEKVKALRCGANNLIIVERLETTNRLLEISKQIDDDVKYKQRVIQPLPNIVYALKRDQRVLWLRAIVKFVRDDGVSVLQMMDDGKIYDFNATKMDLRLISSQDLIDIPMGQMKCLVYGVKKYESNDEFKLIFDSFRTEDTTAIFGPIESKENKLNECFAMDLLYQFNGITKSLREILIAEKVAYPSGVREDINKLLFRKRAEVSVGILLPFFATYEPSSIDAFVRIGGGFTAGQLLGEGSVIIIYYYKFLSTRSRFYH